MVSTSVNSTSATEARMVVVRSSMVSTLIAGGMCAVSLRQLRLDLVDGVDDVGAGLLEDRKHDAVLVVLVGRDSAVGRLGNRLADIAHPDRRAVAIGDARRRCTAAGSMIWSLAAIVKPILSFDACPWRHWSSR